MTTRPNLEEMLSAVLMHVERNLVPVVRSDQRLYFQTLVALNLLKIAQRELVSGAEILCAEWDELNRLTSESINPPAQDKSLANALEVRYRALCYAIRSGQYDDVDGDYRLRLFAVGVVMRQLSMNNPGLAHRLSEEISTDSHPE